ncbi:MAG: ATP-binding protein [Pseudomonadota bacterium]|nr:ATP-binding protein [Pseudomonadota bacterium]
MCDIQLVDVTIHIDRDVSNETHNQVEASLRSLNDVVSVHMPKDRRHLIIVGYNPDKTNSLVLLALVRELAGRSELVGGF